MFTTTLEAESECRHVTPGQEAAACESALTGDGACARWAGGRAAGRPAGHPPSDLDNNGDCGGIPDTRGELRELSLDVLPTEA